MATQPGGVFRGRGRPASVVYRPEPDGYHDLLNALQLRLRLTPLADRVLQLAKANAPVDTGAYRDGLHIEQDSTDRVAVRVAGGTAYDVIVEANTGNLARALDAARAGQL